ncbi:MAG TPA: hypothetical protein VM261_07300 [Kofleriaceae bacterium]|nr:hypothetical protein [Kofleriaceae bacterium]
MIARRWRWRSLASVCVVATALVACGDRKQRADRGPPVRPEIAAIDAAVARGTAFLVGRQESDGAVRSPTYAAFRDGYALTGLAAMPLGMAGSPAFARASDFLVTMIDDGGELRADVAYPTYAAALAVLVLNQPGNERHRGVRDALVAELRARQLGPENGWTEADASFGGWGYYARIPARPQGVIHDDMLSSNLSATLLVVGALTLSGVPASDPALVRARGFVERCQNRAAPCPAACPTDGGFFFSPAVPDANKAGVVAWNGHDLFRSYGSMTADGLRALVRLGGDPARITGATNWLEHHFTAEQNPGEFAPGADVRRASAYYYWTWTAAHALRAIGKPELATSNGTVAWAPVLAKALLARQRPDGSWKNETTEMREDDPVVATSFAVAALLVCRGAMSGEYRSHAGSLVP